MSYDKDMGERLCHYNALAHIHTKLPVHSVVIYLREEKKPWPESPHVVWYLDGRPTLRLDYDTIKLWEIPPETFEQEGLTGLLPLLPLTKGGKSVTMVDRMTDLLKKVGNRDLLAVGHAVAWLAFTDEGGADWLKARFFDMRDILKDTWIFQELMKEGRQEGREEEKKQDIIRYIELRFSPLLALVKQTTEQAMPLKQLQVLLDKLYQANTLEDARSALQMDQAEEQ